MIHALAVGIGLFALVVSVVGARRPGSFPIATLMRTWYSRPQTWAPTVVAGMLMGCMLVLVPGMVRLATGEVTFIRVRGLGYPWILLAAATMVVKVAFVFFEEMVSRGAVITLAQRLVPTPVAILASAVVFSLAHEGRSPADLAVLAADGILFGTAFAISGNLWFASALHVGKNLTIWLMEDAGTLGFASGIFAMVPEVSGWLELGTTALITVGTVLWLLRGSGAHRTPL